MIQSQAPDGVIATREGGKHGGENQTVNNRGQVSPPLFLSAVHAREG